MRRTLSVLAIFTLFLSPALAVAQSGDASWLNNLTGLELAVGRSWMAPVSDVSVETYTDFNDQGTPVSEIRLRTEPVNTPVVTSDHHTRMMSIFVFRFDSDSNAAAGLEKLNDEHQAMVKRDPRLPAIESFKTDLGDKAYGYQGLMTLPTSSGEGNTDVTVLYLMVQDGPMVYQLFGQYEPAFAEQVATDAVQDLIEATPGPSEATYDPNGHSTGGEWDRLNAVQTAFPEESTVADLEIWPMSGAESVPDSVAVTKTDLNNLPAISGLSRGWHIAYAPEQTGTPQATPTSAPQGVYNIEVWIIEFTDSNAAAAGMYSLQEALSEPLGIVQGESGGSRDERGNEIMTLTSIGFVKDRSLPEGDAAFTLAWSDSTVYAVRVYSNGPAPSAVALDIMQHVLDTPAGTSPEDNATATGGTWDRFPAIGSDLLHGLTPISIMPIVQPVQDSTPVG